MDDAEIMPDDFVCFKAARCVFAVSLPWRFLVGCNDVFHLFNPCRLLGVSGLSVVADLFVAEGGGDGPAIVVATA